jgi:hypothetical protein
VLQPLSDLPLTPDIPSYGPYGWIAAGATGTVLILGAVGALWVKLRKRKADDDTSVLDHAKTLIKSHVDYEKLRDKKIEKMQEVMDQREETHRVTVANLYDEIAKGSRREHKCLRRLDWLYTALQKAGTALPAWPAELCEDEP